MKNHGYEPHSRFWKQVVSALRGIIPSAVRDCSSQPFAFAVSVCFFITAAVLGWIKLRYGFNFIDEGWQMTESWRITAGDDFFKDGLIGSGLRGATLINALFFRMYPAVTLLDFRQIQFLLTIVSLLGLGFALYKINRNFWYQPFIFSLFAFTGLEPVGMMSNLNYFTYPHLFITLHLALFIAGLHQQSVLLKRILFIAAGLFLWLVSFSLLHMSLVIFSVILLYVIMRVLKIQSPGFNVKDLTFVLAPVIVLWSVFLAFYGNDFIKNIISDAECFLLTTTHSSFLSVNPDILKRIPVTILFAAAFFRSTRISKTSSMVGVQFILAAVAFMVIDTSLFGLLPPFYGGWYNGWVNRPLWFSALLVSSCFLFLCRLAFRAARKEPWSNPEIYALVLFVPVIIAAVSDSVFSALGALVVLHSAIPAVAAIALFLLSMETVRKRTYIAQLSVLILFFAPFYYTTAWSDWKFTFYDVAPEQANARMESGFGRGIKTNQTYKDLSEWIASTSGAYSDKDDYMISYVSSPMVHMIAQRRPALVLSNIAFNELPYDYFDQLIGIMKNQKREPKIAYVFEAAPVLVPIALENPARVWQNKHFVFSSRDPVSRYVLDHMTMMESFRISDKDALVVRCFVDNATAFYVLKNKLEARPEDPALNLRMGNLYQNRKEYDTARKYYHQALKSNPGFVPALMQSAINELHQGRNNEAAGFLKKIVAIDPGRIDVYYNLSRICARQKRIAESVVWLKKAVEKGFNDGQLLQNDPGFANIRQTAYYQNLITGADGRSPGK